MRYLHARPSLIALLAGALLLAAPAAARSTAQAGETSAPTSDYMTEADSLTTGSIMTPEQKRKKQFDDCMAIWERATHMTKREWRRTCRNQLNEESNL